MQYLLYCCYVCLSPGNAIWKHQFSFTQLVKLTYHIKFAFFVNIYVLGNSKGCEKWLELMIIFCCIPVRVINEIGGYHYQLMTAEKKARQEIDELKEHIKSMKEAERKEKRKLADGDALKKIKKCEDQIVELKRELSHQKTVAYITTQP